MYTLCINDKNNQTQPWWFNFLFSLGDTDVNTGLKKWGGRVEYDRSGYSDTIIFGREEDLVWFILKWT
jgi:hypothetical protein